MISIRGVATALAMAVVVVAAVGQRVLQLRAHPSLKKPLSEIAAEFKKSRKDVTVQFVDSGGADVRLGPASMLGSGSKRLFAIDRIVVVAKADPPLISKLAHIGLSQRLALPAPSAPEHALVNAILELAGDTYGRDWWANVRRNTKVQADDSAEVVHLILEDKADVGLALSSGVPQDDERLKVVATPPNMARTVEHFAKSGTPLGDLFVDFLYSKANQQRLVGHGFSSPIAPVGELVVRYPTSMTKLFTAALQSFGQATIKAPNEAGKATSYSGADLRKILTGKGSRVRFISADGTSISTTMAQLRASGGVLVPMGDGNYRVILAGRKAAEGLRWLRRIDVR